MIPVYNNAPSLPEVVEQLKTHLPQGYEHEIVFVNDGSVDDSLDVLMKLKEENKDLITIVDFLRNFGQLSAILAGLRYSTGDLTVVMSADLQDPFDIIPQMVEEWTQGNHIVAAYRKKRKDSLRARMTSRIAYNLIRFNVPDIPVEGFDFMALDRAVLEEFNKSDTRNRFLQGDLLWFGFNVKYIPYTRLKRKHGKSQYSFFKRLKNFLDAYLDSGYSSIRFMSLTGLLVFVFSILYTLTIFYGKMTGTLPYPGWAPIMILLCFFSGLIMMMLGIIGEYVWRIYDELRGKPNYIVRKVL